MKVKRNFAHIFFTRGPPQRLDYIDDGVTSPFCKTRRVPGRSYNAHALSSTAKRVCMWDAYACSVDISVICLFASLSPELHVQSSPICGFVQLQRYLWLWAGSVLLWRRRCDRLCTSGLKVKQKKYTQRDSTGGSTELAPQRTGAESDIYVRSAFLFMHMLRMVMTRSFSAGVAMYFRYCG